MYHNYVKKKEIIFTQIETCIGQEHAVVQNRHELPNMRLNACKTDVATSFLNNYCEASKKCSQHIGVGALLIQESLSPS